MIIPFHKPPITGKEIEYIKDVIARRALSGDGHYTKQCHEWLEKTLGVPRALLTHSCTAALEMMAILADIKPGDEVIMPSYTFVSTANAFVLRGAVPVFVDVREDTLNIDEKCIEEAITPRTKAIVPVHYAGVPCEMDVIVRLAEEHHLFVFEDAAQALLSRYKGRYLGTIGSLGTFSFHESKHLVSGEGGVLLINDQSLAKRAEIIREKGTNRSQFLRGEIDKYTWRDIGSSYLPAEIVAAFLFAQLEHAFAITERRLHLWTQYHTGLEPLEKAGYLKRQTIPSGCESNGHMYFILVDTIRTQTALIDYLKGKGIKAVAHYVPLHLSDAGKKYGRIGSRMTVTPTIGERIVRLPLFDGLDEQELKYVIEAVNVFFQAR